MNSRHTPALVFAVVRRVSLSNDGHGGSEATARFTGLSRSHRITKAANNVHHEILAQQTKYIAVPRAPGGVSALVPLASTRRHAPLVDRPSVCAMGDLVPIFSLALLWMRRARLDVPAPTRTTWGLAFVVLLGVVLQIAGGYSHHRTLDGFALLPYLSGIALLLGGLRSWIGRGLRSGSLPS